MSSIILAFFVVISVAIAVVRLLCSYFNKPSGTIWLPGPKGIPFIGRIWDIPREHSYLQFKNWSDKFGKIYQINIFGVNHVWVASDEIANELLVKRSETFSDRPQINNLGASKTAPEYLPLLGYNDVWQRQRRFVHQIMSKSAGDKHQLLPFHECKHFLLDLMLRPQELEMHAESYTGRVISRLAFGHVRFADEITLHSHALLAAISPAANLPNIMPQLRLLPHWLSPWKQAECARHAREREFFIKLRREVDKDLAAGSTCRSYMRSFIEGKNKGDKTTKALDELEGAYTVGMVGLAGIITTASALITYVLAMCLHPEWQAKVQEEIDRVCGDRMPRPSDYPDLPVLRAVIKECMRWRPVTPSSIPHESTRDFIYEGHFIPAGSHVHPNQWAITRDATTYPNPESFNPERWLSPTYPSFQEPLTKFPSIKNFTTFGYGRRICMGMDLVEQEFLIGMGSMAWAFNFSKKLDDSGRPMDIPAHDYTSMLISRPRPFQFALEPRSEGREVQLYAQYFDAVRSGEIGGRAQNADEISLVNEKVVAAV
ncbi:cytochrome P450 [Phyllosticta citribraziliensis]|uniref:Cytochrome P450 n=1 Tax=Phyllosticta citribraziliensis TaxID=989973 RepID=A0ABR1LLZ5_9PEZI